MNSEYVLVIGAVTSLFMTEFFGVSPGGLLVPGYVALFFDSPLRLLATIVDAGLALVAARLIARGAILFGRRRYAVFLLAGFVARFILERALPGLAPEAPVLAAIGWLVPGIIASEADRQGPAKTLLALAGAALFVRLLWAALP